MSQTKLQGHLTILTTIHAQIHLLHHRNKNQHRLAKWYKSLNQLRSQAKKFIEEVRAYKDAKGVRDGGKWVEGAGERVRRRVGFLLGGEREGCLGRWWIAFTTLVADNQYAALGLMLIGSLARFRSVVAEVGREVGVNFNLDVENDGLIEEVSLGNVKAENENVGKRGGGDVGGDTMRSAEKGDSDGLGDLGEVVQRGDFASRKEANIDMGNGEKDGETEKNKKRKKQKRTLTDTDTTPETTIKCPKKKKKKGGDAFDDLFGSLI